MVHTQKNWLKCCKNSMKFWLNFQSIMTQRAISIKISSNFYRAKIDGKFWLKFEHLVCVLSQLSVHSIRNEWNFAFWVNSDWTQEWIRNFCVCKLEKVVIKCSTCEVSSSHQDSNINTNRVTSQVWRLAFV